MRGGKLYGFLYWNYTICNAMEYEGGLREIRKSWKSPGIPHHFKSHRHAASLAVMENS
jgi:hypothetical protein